MRAMSLLFVGSWPCRIRGRMVAQPSRPVPSNGSLCNRSLLIATIPGFIQSQGQSHFLKWPPEDLHSAWVYSCARFSSAPITLRRPVSSLEALSSFRASAEVQVRTDSALIRDLAPLPNPIVSGRDPLVASDELQFGANAWDETICNSRNPPTRTAVGGGDELRGSRGRNG